MVASNKKVKYIFITGGVVSSLGKGITAASIGLILKNAGFNVRLQKFDPYLNIDPGTMSPYQHGEVYVTEDGAETDLDLGHYERFVGIPTNRNSNFTAGTIYYNVITKERRGDYLGKTIQVIPHITDEIKRCIRKLKSGNVDIIISEIGGTVGDIESLPFLEAIRQMGIEEGRENVLYIHLTLVPYIKAAGEIKTKPTQHSVGKLREIGIIPDILICRTEKKLNTEIRQKISLFCNVELDSVIEEIDVKKTIYEVPFIFLKQNLHRIIERKLRLKCRKPDLSAWEKILKVIYYPKREVSIAVVGKYSELQDAYKSIYEAILHGGIANNTEVIIKKILAEEIEKRGVKNFFENISGILVPGGFGVRGTEGKIEAIRYARTHNIPFLGICLGMHCAVIEFARNICKMKGAHSTEFSSDTPYPVITLMEEQKNITKKGATMRLGAYACCLKRGTKAWEAYQKEKVVERHRHRFEFNSKYKDIFERFGMVFSGVNPETNLIEIVELKDHLWFVATQFHPEFKSTPINPHPLFVSFIKYALKYQEDKVIQSDG